VQNRQPKKKKKNDFELKFDLRRIIIRNDFGIVTMTITKIPVGSFMKTTGSCRVTKQLEPAGLLI
jgi:hypothetical protein